MNKDIKREFYIALMNLWEGKKCIVDFMLLHDLISGFENNEENVSLQNKIIELKNDLEEVSKEALGFKTKSRSLEEGLLKRDEIIDQYKRLGYEDSELGLEERIVQICEKFGLDCSWYEDTKQYVFRIAGIVVFKLPVYTMRQLTNEGLI